MADAFLSNVLNNLKTFLQGELAHGLVVEYAAIDDLKNLCSTHTAIQPLLHLSYIQQLANVSVREWMENLKDVAYDLDDILDDCNRTLQLTSQLNAADDSASNFSSSNTPLWLFDQTEEPCYNNIACRVKEVRERLDAIWDEKERYPFHQLDWVESTVDHGREPAFLEEKSEEIYGRNEDKEMIISKLVREGGTSSEEGRADHVVCVVGIKGMGKTTLAELVYNDERLSTQFSKRIWVSIDDDFNVSSITEKIIEDVTGDCPYATEWDGLQSMLSEILVADRILLILDDTFSNERTEWKRLILPFKSAGLRSKILVTTDNDEVALTNRRLRMQLAQTILPS